MTSAHPLDDVRINLKECRALAAAGFQVTLVGTGPLPIVNTADPVRYHAVPRPRSRLTRLLLTAPSVMLRARRERADVYHLHDPELLALWFLVKRRRARLVFDAHEDLSKQVASKDWIPPRIRPLAGRVARVAIPWLGRRMDAVIAATPGIRESFPGARGEVVQNFPIRGELTAEAGTSYPDRPALAAYVGALTPIRGAREMVKAVRTLPAGIGLKLRVAGSVTPRSLEEEVLGLEPGAGVELLGWQSREEVRTLLSEARMGLVLFHPVPNHIEAYPTKLFEYMAAGIPVVASAFPLWREIVEGAGCGLVVDPLDATAIAHAMLWLLRHEDEAEAMGRRGIEAVARRYSWENEARKLVSLYAELSACE